jgi:hypothetical protein
MEQARNDYMQQVLRDCAAGVAPAPLADQPFTQYFMTQWSDRKYSGAFPSHAMFATVPGQCAKRFCRRASAVPRSQRNEQRGILRWLPSTHCPKRMEWSHPLVLHRPEACEKGWPVIPRAMEVVQSIFQVHGPCRLEVRNDQRQPIGTVLCGDYSIANVVEFLHADSEPGKTFLAAGMRGWLLSCLSNGRFHPCSKQETTQI